MGRVRRVITGHNAKGRAIVASDTMVDAVPIPGMPGLEINHLWGADKTLSFPDDGSCPEFREFFPPVGGFRFIQFSVPPDSLAQPASLKDEATAHAMEDSMPGLASTMDVERPGMHRSETVDLLYVISGACVLELDDGNTVALRAGDTLVQSGTMHAWRNPHDKPCQVIAVTIGAIQR